MMQISNKAGGKNGKISAPRLSISNRKNNHSVRISHRGHFGFLILRPMTLRISKPFRRCQWIVERIHIQTINLYLTSDGRFEGVMLSSKQSKSLQERDSRKGTLIFSVFSNSAYHSVERLSQNPLNHFSPRLRDICQTLGRSL